MVNYRRSSVPGGTYFFTVTLRNRHSRQLTQSIDLLRQAFRNIRSVKPFQVDAIVILPDHLHAMWTLPPGDMDYPGRWKTIKSSFSRNLEKSGIPVEKRQDGSALVWQRRYWEHTIRDNDDLNRHIDYIHMNPVKSWLGKARSGLALFILPSVCSSGVVDTGLGIGCSFCYGMGRTWF